MSPKNSSSQSQAGAIARRDYFNDPFSEFGDAASQVPSKLPVVKIEYLASESTQREHLDWQEGKFSINIGEQLDKLVVALIGLRYGRILWPEDFDPKNPDKEPLCRSDNGLTPSGGLECPKTDVKARVGGDQIPVCMHFDESGKPVRSQTGRYVPACPFAQWGAKNEAPPCKEFFTLLLWEHTLNIPLIYIVKGTGIKHISQLRMDMMRFQRELPEDIALPPAAYCQIHVTTRKVQRWYEPQFQVAGKFSDIEAEINADAMQDIRPTFESMTADDFEFNGKSEE